MTYAFILVYQSEAVPDHHENKFPGTITEYCSLTTGPGSRPANFRPQFKREEHFDDSLQKIQHGVRSNLSKPRKEHGFPRNRKISTCSGFQKLNFLGVSSFPSVIFKITVFDSQIFR